MDGWQSSSVVRRARSAMCGQRGTKGAGREWSGAQAGFSNSQAARGKGAGREWSGAQAGFSNSRAALGVQRIRQ
ncbi:unnamed protein product, partial [Staurois parvus]